MKAIRMSGGKCVQFGSIDQAKYITVYDNGTILSQGVMGLHYGIDVIAKGLVNEVQRRLSSLKVFWLQVAVELSSHFHTISFLL